MKKYYFSIYMLTIGNIYNIDIYVYENLLNEKFK